MLTPGMSSAMPMVILPVPVAPLLVGAEPPPPDEQAARVAVAATASRVARVRSFEECAMSVAFLGDGRCRAVPGSGVGPDASEASAGVLDDLGFDDQPADLERRDQHRNTYDDDDEAGLVPEVRGGLPSRD